MAGQDYTRLIAPGGSTTIQLNEVEYIYCVQAADPLTVQFDGNSMLMEGGDRHLITGVPFSGHMIVRNDNPNPITARFNAGKGDFTKQIVKGELNVVPSIIKEDGSIISDRRRWLNLWLETAQFFEGLTVQRGEIFSRKTVANDVSQTGSGGLSDNAGEGAGYLGDGVWVVFDGRSSTSNFWLSKIDGADGNVLASQAFSGAGTNINLQDIAVIDQDRYLLVFENGKIYLATWGQSSLTHVVNGPSASALDVGVRSTAIGLSPDQNELYVMRRTGNYTGDVQKASFNAATVAAGSFSEVLTLDIESPSSSRYFQPHDIFHQGQTMLFAYGPFGANVPKNGVVVDDQGTEISDFEATWDYFNGGVNDHTYRVWLAENEAGNLTYWEDTKSRRAVSERWPVSTDFTSYARADDEGQANLVALFQPQDFVYSDANISAQYLGSGRFKLSGEIINFALQTYLQKTGLSGYLDSIYGVQIPKTGGIPAFAEHLTGNQSFARAGMADNFSLIVPGAVRLFVDQTINEV